MRYLAILSVLFLLPLFVGCPVPNPTPTPTPQIEDADDADTEDDTIVDPAITAKAKEIIEKYSGTFTLDKYGDIVAFGFANQDISKEDQELLARLSEVTSFSLVGSSATDEFAKSLENLRKVKQVSMENGNITNAALESFVNYPELKTLSIRRCLKVDSLDAVPKMPKLERLDILYNGFSNGALIRALPNAPKLKHLDLRGIDAVDNTTLRYVSKIEPLESIRLRMAKDTGVGHLKNCPNLKLIELQDASVSPDVYEVFREMPNLKSLRIFRAEDFGAEGIEQLEGLQLETLELRALNCSPEALEKLQGMTTLKSLELSELTDVGTEDVLALLKTLPDLERIYIFDIPVDDTVAEYLATQQKIRNVGMPITGITDKGLAALTTLPNLTHLDIFGNKVNLTIEGAYAIANCKNLKSLVLPETLKDDELFDAIKKNSPNVDIRIRSYSQ